MTLLFLSLALLTLLSSFYFIKLSYYFTAFIGLIILFKFFSIISENQFIIMMLLSVISALILTIKKLRLQLITKPIFHALKKANSNWQNFKRIDNGWFASEFERSIFQGKPQFIKLNHKTEAKKSTPQEAEFYEIILDSKINNFTKINKLSALGATALLINKCYNGQGFSSCEISQTLTNIGKVNPIISAIIGILNLDSLTSFIHHFGSRKQKEKYLPLFASAKMLPFLKPTSLYETLDSQKSSIEGRIEKKFIKNKEVMGIRVSFQDVILLGTSQSNCFYINVNIKDFNNQFKNKTNLGTAICIINKEIKNITYKKGLKAYDDYLHYFSCTGNNVFIPFTHIINEEYGIGKGLEYLYKNQCHASSIWPLATSIPTNKTATLTSWYFAHLQKQNGRQLLSFRVVLSKLNEQFSQCLKLQLANKIALHNNLEDPLLKFTSILNKETHISQTMNQLSLLRGILGSNSHNIKTESKVRSFYKVAHLATELDGMSHEINQLPLIKKASLACHPYYSQEVNLLMNPDDKSSAKAFDQLIIKHVGYILQNLSKTWLYSLRTSFIGRLFFQKNKYKYMIKRMSCSFAFLSDITLINWTFKHKINTSFASHLGDCIQHIISTIGLYDYYVSSSDNTHTKRLAKLTLKNELYASQNALKNTINLAFNRVPTLFIKLLLFPTGRPYHYINANKPIHDNIEEICQSDGDAESPFTNYSPFLKKIYQAKQNLNQAASAEIAVTNATGTPVTTDNYELLINRCLAAGIVSVEQSEQLREAYQSILEIKLTNHFGNHYEK